MIHTKNGFEFSSRKFISLMILLVVFFFLSTYSGDLFGKTRDSISGEKGLISIETEKLCEISNSKSFEIVNCDSNNFNYLCTKEEQDKFDKYIKYLNGKICPGSGEVGVEKDKVCTCVQQKTYDIWKNNNEIQSDINKERQEQLKTQNLVSTSSDFSKLYTNNQELINDFAKKNNVEVSKLKAFIQVESSGKPFYSDGHPIVRFECLKYNLQVQENQKVRCNTDKYKYGNAEDTGKEAFLKVLGINREIAIQTTSFGLGQIMGSNYKISGYGSKEEFYKAMFSEQEQLKAFLSFIKNNNGGVILLELQKKNTDWSVIAYNYNGPGYKNNNYDVKLAEAEQKFKTIIG